jgi:ATP-dependent DNA helicase RecQ
MQEALTFLKRGHRPIEPRKQWPAGIPTRRGNIPPVNRLIEGRALSVYNDAGWGRLVSEAKYREEEFPDDLVEAVAEMIEASWQPEPEPTWVTAIPSLTHPDLVPGFANRLAARLGLPYYFTLRKVKETPPQKTMQNSSQQVANIIDAFAVVAEQLPAGQPGFLVDDIVDSRWSLTVCGVILREAGSGPIIPIAIATASLSN